MGELDNEQSGGVNRRTVAKAIAWAVPAVAVAATVPLASASEPAGPQPPTFNWAAGCATTGSGSGCANLKKTAQVPVSVHNPTAKDLQLQVIGSKSWNTNDTEPATFTKPAGVYTNNGTQNKCTPRIDVEGCGSVKPVSINVAANDTLNVWFVANELGNASAFWMKVRYQWVDPVDCTVVYGPVTATANVISSSNNCS